MVRPSTLLQLASVLAVSFAQEQPNAQLRQPRAPQSDLSLVASLQSLSARFWGPLVDRAVDTPAIDDARYDFVKRQGSGPVTNSTPSVTSSSSTPPDSNTDTLPDSSSAPDTPTVQPPTSTPGDTSTPTPTPTDSDTDTDTPTPTPTDSTPPPSTPPSSDPTSFVTSTTSPNTTPPASSSSSSSSSSSKTPSKTDKPSGSTSSSTMVGTTTAPDGTIHTYTSVVLVHPTPTGSDDATGTKPAPGLQTGENVASSIGMKAEMLAVLGGAVAVAMAL